LSLGDQDGLIATANLAALGLDCEDACLAPRDITLHALIAVPEKDVVNSSEHFKLTVLILPEPNKVLLHAEEVPQGHRMVLENMRLRPILRRHRQ